MEHTEIMEDLYYYGENGMVVEFNKLLRATMDKSIILEHAHINELYHHLLKKIQDKIDTQEKKYIMYCASDLENIVFEL